MPEVEQFTFKPKEVAEALVKAAGVHNGRWQLIVSFGLSAANAGPTEADISLLRQSLDA
jgi:hypothetical protein